MFFKLIKITIFSFLLGFIIVFSIEHFGKFSYLEVSNPDYSKTKSGKISFTRNVPLSAKISTINLKTPFETYLKFDGNDFTVGDMYGSFQEYPNEAKYYFKATLKDFKYVIYFSFGIFSLLFVVINFRTLKSLPNNISKLKGNNITKGLLIAFIIFSSFGGYKYYKLSKKFHYIQYENDELNDRISDLETENEELQSELDESENEIELYKEKYKSFQTAYYENYLKVSQIVEYDILLENNLTRLINQEDPEESYSDGKRKVKVTTTSFNDYVDLARAMLLDLTIKNYRCERGIN